MSRKPSLANTAKIVILLDNIFFDYVLYKHDKHCYGIKVQQKAKFFNQVENCALKWKLKRSLPFWPFSCIWIFVLHYRNCDKEAEEEDESDLTSDDDDLVSVASAASRSIRWSDTNPKPPRRPKSRLMPSFTKKSLEFHTCPSEAVPKLILGISHCHCKIRHHFITLQK